MSEKDCGCYVQVSLGIGCRDRSECRFSEAVELIRKLLAEPSWSEPQYLVEGEAKAFLKKLDGISPASGAK